MIFLFLLGIIFIYFNDPTCPIKKFKLNLLKYANIKKAILQKKIG